MAEFYVQLYRMDADGRTRPDGAEAIVEADDSAEAAFLVAGQGLTTTPGEDRYAAKVWTVVDYAAVSTDFFWA